MKLLPSDARRMLADATLIDKHLPAGESRNRQIAIEKATEYIKRKYPTYFQSEYDDEEQFR
jgi:hypothetical protein